MCRHRMYLWRSMSKPAASSEFDFVADNPSMTLFHCHQQLHMDFGFMALFRYHS